ncbi:TetR family transcriptional regulator [Streptomyces nojiriensis]|uniref:TetR family transcriptional regulator n=1 Tax=Streptomyces nojiriensis TaxID=66374 RepID=A0ABQ3SHY6_9ACTN|nr:TetR/AcrR family transcriptional regulator [Streptomyces nojiriensis]QTI49373.1 Putative mycofactocin biosynthesis transcriptional regulator MftR [Streptomyces nojiriensis]GGS36727.1 TetR family transcriptional regulator [Streptomyces nojiriensis]GHI67751.1 TetR family transcriptional regulator [Streptomyces nojiriensis]
MTATVGRRERKKAATRQALADTALNLFLERGYDGVTIRDVADAVDVSTTTLLKYFPTKEALVFDEDAEQETGLVAAVRDRPEGQGIPQALCAYIKRVRTSAGDGDVRFAAFVRLVDETPALSEYGHRMWMRHRVALARAIAEAAGSRPDDYRCAALAHFALEASAFAHRSDDPERAMDAAFALLQDGWGTA